MEENRFSLCKVWSNILWCVLRCIGAPRGLNQFVLILPFYLLTGRAVKWVANSKHRHISPNHTTPNLITPQFTSPGHTSLVTLSYAPCHRTSQHHIKLYFVPYDTIPDHITSPNLSTPCPTLRITGYKECKKREGLYIRARLAVL